MSLASVIDKYKQLSGAKGICYSYFVAACYSSLLAPLLCDGTSTVVSDPLVLDSGSGRFDFGNMLLLSLKVFRLLLKFQGGFSTAEFSISGKDTMFEDLRKS